MKKLTAIIPARKGSKSIRNKNRILLNDIPLVEYSIIIAKLCKHIENIYLTTDDNIILDIGRKYNIQVINRPAELATDKAKSLDVIKHVIESYNVLEDIILLEPTSPIRLLSDLNNGISKYFDENLDSMYSLSELTEVCIPHIKKVDEKGNVADAFIKEVEGAPRQVYNNDRYYYRDGIFYIFKKKIVLENNTLYGVKSKGFITPHEAADINNLDDLYKAERLIKQEQYQFYQKKQLDRKIIYIDIDDTICYAPEDKDYSNEKPIEKNIEKANKMYDEGNYIIYWTARGNITGIDWKEITEKQLKEWNVKYHEIKFGKPNWHLLIDDRALNTREW